MKEQLKVLPEFKSSVKARVIRGAVCRETGSTCGISQLQSGGAKMRTYSQIRHKTLKLRIAWLLPAFALLIACSGIPLKERMAAERERYEAYAGNPIDHFTYLGRFDGWEPIGRHELVVWTGINDAYLIKVAPPCEDLQFANRIGLTSTGGTVYSRFLDSVKVRGWNCPIQEIRPVDYKRLRQDLRRELQQAKIAQENRGM